MMKDYRVFNSYKMDSNIALLLGWVFVNIFNRVQVHSHYESPQQLHQHPPSNVKSTFYWHCHPILLVGLWLWIGWALFKKNDLGWNKHK